MLYISLYYNIYNTFIIYYIIAYIIEIQPSPKVGFWLGCFVVLSKGLLCHNEAITTVYIQRWGHRSGPWSPRPKYVRCARSSADAFCPSGGGADAVWRCADPLGMRSNLRERARTMALSGGVGGSSLGRAAVGLQHLKGDSAIRFTHKIRQRAVISCMINLHTILMWRTMWGELVGYIVVTLGTEKVVFGSFSIICDDIAL